MSEAVVANRKIIMSYIYHDLAVYLGPAVHLVVCDGAELKRAEKYCSYTGTNGRYDGEGQRHGVLATRGAERTAKLC